MGIYGYTRKLTLARLWGMDRASAAEKYRPKKIDLSLVAETPPKELDRYFYFESVESHDWLFRHVFEVLFSVIPNRSAKTSWLNELKKRGIFLIDLKPDPLDKSNLKDHVDDLVRRCKELRPRRIILIKATVYKTAYEHLFKAGLPVIDQQVNFPSTGQQNKFREQFAKALAAVPANIR